MLREGLRLSLNALKAIQAKATLVDSDGRPQSYKVLSLCENALTDIRSARDMLVSHPVCLSLPPVHHQKSTVNQQLPPNRGFRSGDPRSRRRSVQYPSTQQPTSSLTRRRQLSVAMPAISNNRGTAPASTMLQEVLSSPPRRWDELTSAVAAAYAEEPVVSTNSIAQAMVIPEEFTSCGEQIADLQDVA
jgi:hypothetical protein